MKTSRPVRPSWAACLAASLAVAAPAASDSGRRALKPGDVLSLRAVAEPRVSPDGDWVAYTVERLDAERDASDTDVYMVPWAGGEPVRLTASEAAETAPRFSPDGRFLAFLSDRGCDATQVFLLDRRGGEARRLTRFPGGVGDLAWSPDGHRLALVVSDSDPEQPPFAEGGCKAKPAATTTKPPIVIRRLQFKRDTVGYLRDLHDHLVVWDVETGESRPLTSGPYDDSEPAWSPDGRSVAFVSNRTAHPDANRDTDVFVVAAEGGEPRQLTTTPSSDTSPRFSPDGGFVAYLAGGDVADMWYDTHQLAIVPVAGGEPRALTGGLDRNVLSPRFSPDGAWLLFRLEDAGTQRLARVPASGGAIETLLGGERVVRDYDVAHDGRIAVLESVPDRPEEVLALEDGALRRLTHTNDAFLAGIELGPVERFPVTSPDGTPIDGFLVRPPGRPAEPLPTLLWIHGGPVDQYDAGFEQTLQVLAAGGYAVLAMNPRGSSGYGRDFSRAIWADWGNLDYQDVMAAVDAAVERGIADPERLGVGGWSYGGILTDNVLTRTDRFRAAMSGASEVNYTANYGTDHYQYEWETELGLPWQSTDLWLRLSPFFRVERITTPTLVMSGEIDVNIPVLNSEQLYMALRRQGVETELIVYPGQYHAIRTPSYQRDRYERWLAWFDRHLKGERPRSPSLPR